MVQNELELAGPSVFSVHFYCCYCPITVNSFFCQRGNKLQGTHGYRWFPGVIFQCELALWYLSHLQDHTELPFLELVPVVLQWIFLRV